MCITVETFLSLRISVKTYLLACILVKTFLCMCVCVFFFFYSKNVGVLQLVVLATGVVTDGRQFNTGSNPLPIPFELLVNHTIRPVSYGHGNDVYFYKKIIVSQ